jgi:transposase-like protein
MSIVAQSAPSDESRPLQMQALRTAIQDQICPDIAAAFNRQLALEVTGFLQRPKGCHRAALPCQESELLCAACGCHQTLDFVRKGYYERTELTQWGAIPLSVPRVECRCGHCPLLPFLTIARYDRLWGDVTQATLTLVALDVSLRSTAEVVRLQSGLMVSISTVQRRVQRMGVQAETVLKQKLAQSPAAVMVDAIWGTRLADTGEKKRDKKNRLRPVKRGGKIPLLIAESIDPVNGETALLAWVEGKAESVADWTHLLTVLYERGVCARTGLRVLIHDGCGALDAALGMVDFGPVRRQRCIFHKLKNVLRDVSGEPGMTREERSARVRAVVEEASAIYEAESAMEARRRAAAFRSHWSESEPKAVATLERELEATLTYYAVCAEAAARGETWDPVHLRTTSPLEGLNRSLRAKWRQSGSFWSTTGWMGALWLVAKRRERQTEDTTEDWLEQAGAWAISRQIEPNFPIP